MPKAGSQVSASIGSGGGNLTEFYALTFNSETKRYEVGEKVFYLNSVESTKVSRGGSSGTASIDYNQYEDSADLEEFIETYQAQSTENKLEVTFEDGSKLSTAGGVEKMLLALVYGAKNAEGSVKVTIVPGYVAGESGDFEQKSGSSSAPGFKFEGIVPIADITVAQAKFNAEKVIGVETILKEKKKVKSVFLKAKAVVPGG